VENASEAWPFQFGSACGCGAREKGSEGFHSRYTEPFSPVNASRNFDGPRWMKREVVISKIETPGV
jgi:hypothetical protein